MPHEPTAPVTLVASFQKRHLLPPARFKGTRKIMSSVRHSPLTTPGRSSQPTGSVPLTARDVAQLRCHLPNAFLPRVPCRYHRRNVLARLGVRWEHSLTHCASGWWFRIVGTPKMFCAARARGDATGRPPESAELARHAEAHSRPDGLEDWKSGEARRTAGMCVSLEGRGYAKM